MPSTPIFGGVKHFMTAMPYLAVLAGIGLARLVPVLAGVLPAARARLRRVAPAALAALVCLPAVVETRRSHPDGLSHYNLLAGGFAGGASLGMNRQFWGYSVLPMLDVINRDTAANREMYWHDVIDDAVSMYKRDGRLAMTVGNTGLRRGGARAARSWASCSTKSTGRSTKAGSGRATARRSRSCVREREGVPLVTMYRRGQP